MSFAERIAQLGDQRPLPMSLADSLIVGADASDVTRERMDAIPSSEPNQQTVWRKGTLISLLLVVLIVFGGVAYFFLSGRTPTTPRPTQTAGDIVSQPGVSTLDQAASRPSSPSTVDAARSPAPVQAPLTERPAAPPAQIANPAPRNGEATNPASRNLEVLFLQRSGVNVRSAASRTSRVVGTARKGTRFEVTNRQGRWVEVNSGRIKGWISDRFLASNAP
jgi:Bacterial SH3 domain